MHTVFGKREPALAVGVYVDPTSFLGAVKVIAVAPDGQRVMEAFMDERLYEAMRDAGLFEQCAEILLHLDRRRPARTPPQSLIVASTWTPRGD